MRALEIEARGLDEFIKLFEDFPQRANEAARLAVIETARFARRQGSKEIRDQVNFSRGYLGDEKTGRLVIGYPKRADGTEAVILGRDRPTSLARFAVGNTKPGRRKSGNPVKVRVSSKGGTETLKRGFFIRLRQGKVLDDENFNVGLAVRLAKGERLQNKRQAILIASGLYLLYGPSVGQVFSAVAEDIEPEVSEKLETEFLRQFDRLESKYA